MDEAPGWLQAIAMVAGVASAALLSWWTIVAFVGGALWPLSIQVEGGIGFGLLWLFIIDPLAATALSWAFMALVLPLVGVASLRQRRPRLHRRNPSQRSARQATKAPWISVPTAGLPPAPAHGVAVGPNGTVWAATDRGLAWTENGKWQYVALPASPASAPSGFVYRWPGHNAVAATDDMTWLAGGHAFDGHRWNQWPTPDDGGPGAQRMALGSDRALWATTMRGPVRFDGHQWRPTGSHPFKNYYALAADSAGRLWCTGTHGPGSLPDDRLAHWDGQSWFVITEHADLRGFMCMEVAENGEVWGTFNDGVARLTPSHSPAGWIGTIVGRIEGAGWMLDWFTHRDGLPVDTRFRRPDDPSRTAKVYDLAVEPDGTVWAATEEGISRFDGSQWHTPNDAPSGPALGVAAAATGDVWVATGRGPFHFDGQRWLHASVDDGYPPAHVYGLAARPGKRLWAACTAGLARFDGHAWDTWSLDEIFEDPGEHISAIAVDLNGALWAASKSKITKLGENDERRITRLEGFYDAEWPLGAPEQDAVCGLAADTSGDVWVGTLRGIGRFDGQGWHVHTDLEGLPGPITEALSVGPDGTVWAVSGGVLVQWDGRRWIEKTDHQWSGYDISQLAVLPSGGVLLATGFGLHRVDESGSVTQARGLPNEDVSAVVNTPDGLVWVGTQGGLACWDRPGGTGLHVPVGLATRAIVDLAVTSSGQMYAATESDGIIQRTDTIPANVGGADDPAG